MKKQIQIDWETAPEWANWFAVDADGWGFFYEQKPHEGMFVWGKTEGYCFWCGSFDASNWRESLQQRPNE